MNLYRLNVVEERIIARDEEDAILGAFQDIEDMEFAGYINVEQITEPEATVYLTKGEIMALSYICKYHGDYLDGAKSVYAKLSQAITQIAVQTVMVKRAGENG